MKNQFVSIIISVYNEEKTIRECLSSLLQQNYSHHEVIVVDSSQDNSAEIAKEFPCKLIKFKKRKSVPQARNIGIKKAKGNILIFTDADCVFKKDWLQRLIKGFDSPEVGMVGGPDVAPKDDSFLAKSIDYTLTSFVGTGGVRRGEKMRIGRYYPRGCNLAVLSDLIKKVGVFNEELVPGEEIDLGYRIKKAGYRLKYVADAFVWHRRRRTIGSFTKQIFSRGYSRYRLGRAHRELLEFAYTLPALMIISFFLLFLFSFISPPIFKLLITTACFYLLILLISGIDAMIKLKDKRCLLLIPFLLVFQHFVYGLGFLKGLFRIK